MPPPAVTPDSADSSKRVKWRDGTFSGWGTSRHGDVEVTVIIEGGKITAAAISRCLTRYSCSWIAHLQPQVVERQSPEVDNVSGATESANAFYYAVLEALKHAAP
ncbi:FMN-binding protein [Gemmatimonas phototrophica]|uniref:FMN-binding protein n=1 Tax=Gemmatimonas phototrophica TaxID=1379270 RepID=UPI00131401B9|nr:FMN-binding protein [Gemmatimonas phototrophica]